MNYYLKLSIAAVCLFVLSSGQQLYAQEKLLNAGFEQWDAITELPTEWDAPANTGRKESAIKLNGNAALRIGPVTNGYYGKLSQEYFLPTTAKAGDIYEFTINYYVVKSMGGNDLKITSAWYNKDYDPIPHNMDLLDNGTLFTSVNTWGQKKFRITVPTGAISMNFRIQAQTGVEVIYDDFSLMKISATDPDVPTLSTAPTAVPGFVSAVGQQQSATINVAGSKLLGAIQMSLEGIDASEFKLSASTIAQATASGELTITYKPTTEGTHNATLKISSAGASALSIPLIGSTGAAKQLLSNPGFEITSSSPLFGITVEDWSFGGMKATETTDKLEGKHSLKLYDGKQATNILEQEVTSSTNTFVEGDIYEMVIRYKVVTSQGGNDIKINSFWEVQNEGPSSHDAAVLDNGQLFTSATWAEKKIRTTVPKGGNRFQFRVALSKNVAALVDDFSFKKVDEPIGTDPVLRVSSTDMISLSTTLNTPKASAPLTITSANLPNAVTLAITGTGAAHFSSSVTTIPTSTIAKQTPFIITYHPKVAGSHEATLTIDCLGAEILSQTITLRGTSNDPTLPPTISYTPAAVPGFKVALGKDSTYTIEVTGSNLTEYLYASVVSQPAGCFTIKQTMIPKNTTAPFPITFRPTVEGRATGTITLTSKDATTVTIELTGEGTKGGDTPVEEFDRVLAPLDNSNPLRLLNEKFDAAAVHNKTLKVAGWRNVVTKGERGWWGFDHKDTQSQVVLEKTAKATAYIYQATSSTPYEMWLVTPALDFKNAESKIFTFRVMGNFLFENHPAALELFYLDQPEGQEMFAGKVDMPMPSISDENGEWREYHIDLTEQNISDVFFMAFKYTGPSGADNSVVFYIDDVSFGRTDLPTLASSVKSEIIIETQVNTSNFSPKIAVSGSNLVMPISITVSGANPSKFLPSAATLPISGGSFAIEFKPTQVGIHMAYVLISSRGAADIMIPLVGRSTASGSSVELLEGESAQMWQHNRTLHVSTKADQATIQVLELEGRLIATRQGGSATFELEQGVYIVQITTSRATMSRKMVIQ